MKYFMLSHLVVLFIHCTDNRNPGFPTWTTLPMLMYVSEPALHHSCAAHPNKMAPLPWSCGMDGQLAWPVQGFTYVKPRDTQGLEALPRTSVSHLALDPGSRPSAAQLWPELSMATRPGQTTLDAARANGYAPVRGTPVMMMTDNRNSFTSLSTSRFTIRSYSRWDLHPKVNFRELLGSTFYRLDAFPVTQTTLSKQWKWENEPHWVPNITWRRETVKKSTKLTHHQPASSSCSPRQLPAIAPSPTSVKPFALQTFNVRKFLQRTVTKLLHCTYLSNTRHTVNTNYKSQGGSGLQGLLKCSKIPSCEHV